MNPYRSAMPVGSVYTLTGRCTRDGSPIGKYDHKLPTGKGPRGAEHDVRTLDEASRKEYEKRDGVWVLVYHWEENSGVLYRERKSGKVTSKDKVVPVTQAAKLKITVPVTMCRRCFVPAGKCYC